MLEINEFMGKEVKRIGDNTYFVVGSEFIQDDVIDDYTEENLLCINTIEKKEDDKVKIYFVFKKSSFEESIKLVNEYLQCNNLGLLSDYYIHSRPGIPVIGGIYESFY